MRHKSSIAAAILVAGIGISACSNSGSTSAKANSKSGDKTETTSAGGASAGDCPATALTGTIDGKPFTATSAAAVSLDGGKGYTMYLADFPVKAADLSMVSTPTPAAGKTLVTVADTVFNAPNPDAVRPVKAGDNTTYTPDFGKRTFTVVAQTGEKPFQSNEGGKGSLKITKAGDQFCGTVDYSDNEKSIKGTFAAPVKAL